MRLIIFSFILQEDMNRGKPNWEHLSDELHVLITVEDTENRARVRLQRALDEIQKLLVPTVRFKINTSNRCPNSGFDHSFFSIHLWNDPLSWSFSVLLI